MTPRNLRRVFKNVYSLTWIKHEQPRARGILCCWLLVLVIFGCMIGRRAGDSKPLSTCVGEGRYPHHSLPSLAPALNPAYTLKTNFEINRHLINILHAFWRVVSIGSVFQTLWGNDV